MAEQLDVACIMCGGDCTKDGPVNPACPRLTEGALHDLRFAPGTVVNGSLDGFDEFFGPLVRVVKTGDSLTIPDAHHSDPDRERHDGYVRKWLQNPEFRAALNRATHRKLKP